MISGQNGLVVVALWAGLSAGQAGFNLPNVDESSMSQRGFGDDLQHAREETQGALGRRGWWFTIVRHDHQAGRRNGPSGETACPARASALSRTTDPVTTRPGSVKPAGGTVQSCQQP